MSDFVNEIKIPQDRIAVLIGKDGESKALIEKATKSKLSIDSHEGEVSVTGDDPLTLFTAAEIVKAVGRGVNPEIALLLTKMDYVLEIISIGDYAKTKNDMIRLKGRVIGQEGKSRRVMEDLLDIHLVVYGKTISIVGRGDDVVLARRAVDSLLSGSPHSHVFQMLERLKKKFKQQELQSEGGF